MATRIITGVIGLFFFAQGIHWIARPVAAAEALGMPLLDGIGRSTQIGDIGGFFIALGGMVAFGAFHSSPNWLRAGAVMLGAAAIVRTLAWLLHGAPLTVDFISVELLCAGGLVLAASRFPAANEPISR